MSCHVCVSIHERLTKDTRACSIYTKMHDVHRVHVFQMNMHARVTVQRA
jgi:hypothetical protein